MRYVQEHFPGSAGFPFVIPSEAEGSAVLFIHKPISPGSATLSFVIPSEAEGSAVQRTSLGNVELRNKTKGAPHLARFSRDAPTIAPIAFPKTYAGA